MYKAVFIQVDKERFIKVFGDFDITDIRLNSEKDCIVIERGSDYYYLPISEKETRLFIIGLLKYISLKYTYDNSILVSIIKNIMVDEK